MPPHEQPDEPPHCTAVAGILMPNIEVEAANHALRGRITQLEKALAEAESLSAKLGMVCSQMKADREAIGEQITAKVIEKLQSSRFIVVLDEVD